MAALVVIVIIVVVLMHKLFKEFIFKTGYFLECLKDVFSRKIVPGCCDDLCGLIVLSDHLDDLVKLLFGHVLCSGKNDRARIFDLVYEELTEVLHVDLTLGSVYDNYG